MRSLMRNPLLAIAAGFPYIAYQIYAFIAPGLYKNERSAVLPYLFLMPLLFVAGGAVALAMALSGRGVPEPRTLPVTLRAALVLAVVANWAWLVFDGR